MSSTNSPEAVPHPVDLHVGGRLRARRRLLGLTQEKLAEALGLTFQQVQKYERGVNRVSASRLFEVAQVLTVPVTFFFEGFHDSAPTLLLGVAESEQEGFESDQLSSRETQDLLRAYYRIPSATLRRRVIELLRAMSDGDA